jgi:hypothetical protein
MKLPSSQKPLKENQRLFTYVQVFSHHPASRQENAQDKPPVEGIHPLGTVIARIVPTTKKREG